MPLPPHTLASDDNWLPYEDKVQFKTDDFLFCKDEMSPKNINYLLELWGLSLMKHGDLGPFDTYKQIYETIDVTMLGDAPWKCFQAGFDIDLPKDAPHWKQQSYEVWYCDPDMVITNLLDNPDFDGEFDTTPYVHLDVDGKCHWSDFMSSNYPWCHCVWI
ncbi:hypothetical protein L208DRAFT_1375340 [Tricholoma matsutake]|nr:hypothetical protein L208DRAFT_1375340 [Tricholoma matsutake 945]